MKPGYEGISISKESILESLAEQVFYHDKELRIVWANSAACQYVGLSREDLIGCHCYEVYAQSDKSCAGCPVLTAIENGKSHEIEKVAPDGRNWLIKGYPVIDEKGEGVGGVNILFDITRYQRSEETLRKNEHRQKVMLNNVPDMVWMKDDKGRFLAANESYGRTCGKKPDELIGKTDFEIWPFELARRYQSAEDAVLESGMKLRLEERLADSRGKNVWIETIKTPVYNNEDKIVGIVGIARDISDRKRAEEKRKMIEGRLRQSQKMEAIGTLAGGVAHDFNNLLMGIQGRISLMLMNMDSAHLHFGRLKQIEEIVDSGANLTKQLLGFAKRGKYDIKVTDVNEIVKKSSKMFSRAKKEIKVYRKYERNVWKVKVDQGQIEQVLLSLYINAWQAMPDGGEVRIETKNVTIDKKYADAFNIEPGKYVKTSVSDTGVGIDEKMKERIFEPFFTTKEMQRGTGLGLASSYGIITNHGGIIDFQSEKGLGTTFDIYLPVYEKNAFEEKKLPDDILKGSETVLLVDDEEMIREIGEQVLKTLGYEVLVARGGKEATELYKKEKEKISIVILDMIMPDMDGSKTFSVMKEMNPNVKVILSSGYSINEQVEQIMKHGCNSFIQKPFSVKLLSETIRDVLDAK